MDPSRHGGLSRRSFVKAAVAIGGTAALSACMGREDPDLPTGTDDPSSLPTRQHAWNAALPTDDHGNDVAPRHHALALFDLDGSPTVEDREAVRAALQSLERAYPWSNEGLVFVVGYSPAYFDRFDASLPDSVDLQAPRALAPFEDPALDTADFAVHLASDYGSVVLGAEAALAGDREQLNGLDVASFPDSVARVDRRTGFVGEGLPAENQDVTGIPDSEPVPEDAPLYMGFESGFEKNQASEDRVTIPDGPFVDGTTMQVSKLRLHLEQWYEQDDRFHRVATMFCPVHAEEELVEETGKNLGNTTEIEERGCPAHASEDAESGVVGHAQKAARAREDGTPRILRRDFDSTDDDRATVHFVSLQQTVEDFAATRTAMTGTDLAEDGAVGQRTNNGILQYLTVERRGNYLVPPRQRRALPRPVPE